LVRTISKGTALISAVIEALCQSDPELASMLSIFVRIPAPEGPDARYLTKRDNGR
jgi:hypothetical protein